MREKISLLKSQTHRSSDRFEVREIFPRDTRFVGLCTLLFTTKRHSIRDIEQFMWITIIYDWRIYRTISNYDKFHFNKLKPKNGGEIIKIKEKMYFAICAKFNKVVESLLQDLRTSSYVRRFCSDFMRL